MGSMYTGESLDDGDDDNDDGALQSPPVPRGRVDPDGLDHE